MKDKDDEGDGDTGRVEEKEIKVSTTDPEKAVGFIKASINRSLPITKYRLR